MVNLLTQNALLKYGLSKLIPGDLQVEELFLLSPQLNPAEDKMTARQRQETAARRAF